VQYSEFRAVYLQRIEHFSEAETSEDDDGRQVLQRRVSFRE
jgi:hypothetical protein